MAEEQQPNPPQLIEFHSGRHERFPKPYPASRAIAEWYKNLPIEATSTGPEPAVMPTVKRCPPFLEAMSCGYIIPFCADAVFTTDARGNLTFEATGPMVETHNPAQYRGTPFAAALLVKFINPWIIKTPPGYSTLVLPALNRFHIPFLILSGLIETDTYYREINFPAICQLPPNVKYQITRGTPLAQVIPFRREPWQSAAGEYDNAQRLAIEHAIAANLHIYKDEHWRKKSFE